MDWQSDPTLREFRKSFVASFAERLARLDRVLAGIGVAVTPELREQACGLVHKLAGASGSYGFENLSRVSGALDDWLLEDSAWTEPAKLLRYLSVLRDLLADAARRGRDPELTYDAESLLGESTP